MSYYIDTYQAPAEWHADTRAIVTWLKNKATKGLKARLSNENEIIIEIVDYLKNEKYINATESPTIVSGDNYYGLIKYALTQDRTSAYHIIKHVQQNSGKTIRQILKEYTGNGSTSVSVFSTLFGE